MTRNIFSNYIQITYFKLGNCRRDCQRDHCNLPYTSAKKMLMRYFHSFDFKKFKKTNSLKQKFLIAFLVFKALCKNQRVGKCMFKVSKPTYCNIFFRCYFPDLVCLTGNWHAFNLSLLFTKIIWSKQIIFHYPKQHAWYIFTEHSYLLTAHKKWQVKFNVPRQHLNKVNLTSKNICRHDIRYCRRGYQIDQFKSAIVCWRGKSWISWVVNSTIIKTFECLVLFYMH